MPPSDAPSAGLLRGRLPRLTPHTILRPRVHDKLDLRTPMTVMVAPQGYGKTVGLVNWLHRRYDGDEALVWLDAHRVGGDTGLLGEQLVEALGGEVERGAPLPELAELLDLVEGAADPVLIVLDAAERLDDPRMTETLIELTRLSTSVRVVLSTRHLGRSLAALGRQVELTVVTAADLRFSEEQTLTLARQCGLEGGDLSELRALHQEVDGWPSLVHRLVLEAATMAPAVAADLADAGMYFEVGQTWLQPGEAALSTAREAVRRSIREELNDSLPDEEDRSFARRAACAFRLDRSNIGLLGDSEQVATARLESLVRVGLVTERPGSSGPSYRMAPLIRQALAVPCADTLPSDEIDEIRRRFVAHFRDWEQWLDAVEQAMELDDSALLVDLVAECWYYVLVAKPDLLVTLFERIPSALLAENPMAQSALAMFLDVKSVPEHQDTLPADDSALEKLAEQQDVESMMLEQLTVMLAARMAGQLDVAARLGRKLPVIAQTARRIDVERVRASAPSILLHSAISHQVAGDDEAAVALFALTEDIGEDDPVRMASRNAQSALAHIHAVRGELTMAREWLELAREHPPYPGWIGRRLATSLELAEVWMGLESLDRALVEPLVGDLAAKADEDELWGAVVQVESHCELLWGDSNAMLDRLAALERRRLPAAGDATPSRLPTSPPGPLSAGALALGFAAFDHRLALGHVGAARKILLDIERASPLAHPERPGMVIRRARLALLIGQPTEVLATADPAGSLVVRDRAELTLLRAAAALDLGNEAVAKSWLHRAVVHLQRTGMRLPLLTLPSGRLDALAALNPRHSDLLSTPKRQGWPAVYPEAVREVLLTDRELEILRASARRVGNEQIAEAQGVTVNTLKTQIRGLYRKLDVQSRVDALMVAREHGLDV